jgi:hypothetical protein
MTASAMLKLMPASALYPDQHKKVPEKPTRAVGTGATVLLRIEESFD